jgi:hypothetical protein
MSSFGYASSSLRLHAQLRLYALAQRVFGPQTEKTELYFARLLYVIVIEIAAAGTGVFAFSISQAQQTERSDQATERLSETKISAPTLDVQLRALETRMNALEQAIKQRPAQRIWKEFRKGGDCSGLDAAQSQTAAPAPEKCTSDLITAVCWDGVQFQDGPSPWCTYKRVAAEQCTGGLRPGIVYARSQQQ